MPNQTTGPTILQSISLDDSRDKERIHRGGYGYLVLPKTSGHADIYLDESDNGYPDEKPYSTIQFVQVFTPSNGIWLSNDAQSGKTLELLIFRDYLAHMDLLPAWTDLRWLRLGLSADKTIRDSVALDATGTTELGTGNSITVVDDPGTAEWEIEFDHFDGTTATFPNDDLNVSSHINALFTDSRISVTNAGNAGDTLVLHRTTILGGP